MAEFGTQSFYFTDGALIANQESGDSVVVVAGTIKCTKNSNLIYSNSKQSCVCHNIHSFYKYPLSLKSSTIPQNHLLHHNTSF